MNKHMIYLLNALLGKLNVNCNSNQIHIIKYVIVDDYQIIGVFSLFEMLLSFTIIDLFRDRSKLISFIA